jgi:nucleoside phosphorylase
MEAEPFVRRLEIRRTYRLRRATYMEGHFEGRPVLVLICGVGPQRARLALKGLHHNISGILCAGTAGSLTTDLTVGEIVLAQGVTATYGSRRTVRLANDLTTTVKQACVAEGLLPAPVMLVTSEKAILDRQDRERTRTHFQAHAVDMESHVAALHAEDRGVPCSVLRVISDDVYSPPFPRRREFRDVWTAPAEMPSRLAEWVRWNSFLRSFRRSVNLLPPVLIRAIRAWKTRD